MGCRDRAIGRMFPGDRGLFSFSCRVENPVLIIMANCAPSRRATPLVREGRPHSSAKGDPTRPRTATPYLREASGIALYIRRRGRVSWEIRRMMAGAGRTTSLCPTEPLDGRVAPRTDGILVPMRKDSHGHGNGAVAGVKMSVSLRFQSKSIVKQADSD